MERISKKDKEAIVLYYKDLEIPIVFIEGVYGLWKLFKVLLCSATIVTSDRWVRRIAKRLGIKIIAPQDVLETSKSYLAFRDSLLLLSKKNIPVYFYNRIGKEKEGYIYSDSAHRRMEQGLSFPKMYENIDAYEDDWRELFGAKYSKEYVEKIGKIPQVIKKGNVFCHEDVTSEFINVINGKRITCYQPENTDRTLHFYGRCGAFGYAVEDKDTLPSLLQKELLEKGVTDIRVVNHGLWGGEDSCIDNNFINDSSGMKEGDVVLFYRMHLDKRIQRGLEKYGMSYKEITHEWHEHLEAKYCFYDKPGHMNNVGYRIVASIICDDLMKRNFSCLPISDEVKQNTNLYYLTEYLKTYQNTEFFKGIDKFVHDIVNKYPLTDKIKTCGAIVMNCNPFTKGHRYLIEYAATRVDRLYVFVVEENKSFFKFKDRLEMVENGVADLPNVVVTSSGKFMISSYTFPEYFMKDYVKEKDFDVTNDLELFCKYIAPPLHIKLRFAGEEPLDPVTLNYNENMRKILPCYGIEFCEIPRLALDENRVINATEVRRLLKEGNLDAIKEYVPQSTYDVLTESYFVKE